MVQKKPMAWKETKRIYKQVVDATSLVCNPHSTLKGIRTFHAWGDGAGLMREYRRVHNLIRRNVYDGCM